MAKPIKSTPVLTGKDADGFLKKMLDLENSRVTFKSLPQQEISLV